MALNEQWQSLAMCHVKQAHGFMLYADQEQMASDDERYVTWNWCTRKEGVTFEEISAKHAEYAADMQEDSGGIIGWLVMLPHTGGADAAGEFAHVAIYPRYGILHGTTLHAGQWRLAGHPRLFQFVCGLHRRDAQYRIGTLPTLISPTRHRGASPRALRPLRPSFLTNFSSTQ